MNICVFGDSVAKRGGFDEIKKQVHVSERKLCKLGAVKDVCTF